MELKVTLVVDMGPEGTVAEQLHDAGNLHRAIREAVYWHGSVLHLETRTAQENHLLFDRDGVAQPLVQRALNMAVAGVEWGGR